MNNMIMKRIGVIILSAIFSLTGMCTGTFAADNDSSKSYDSTVSVSVEKIWKDYDNANTTRPKSITVDLKNGNKAVDTISISSNDGEWKGTFKDVPRFDADGEEINYIVSERPISGYKSSVEMGDITSHIEYPTNVSDEILNTDTTTSPAINATGGTSWNIQPGLRTDYIESSQIIFNLSNLLIQNATLTEYDGQGNEVPDNERVFLKTNSSGQVQDDDSSSGVEVRFIPKETYAVGTLIETDHYFTLVFNNGATVLDGSTVGSQKDVTLTLSNFSVYKYHSQNWHRVAFDGTDSRFWIGPMGGNDMGGQVSDLTISIDGVSSGTTLLSFVDIDIVSDGEHGDGPSRRESIYLLDDFDHTIYTLPLRNPTTSSITHVQKTNFVETADGELRAYSREVDSGGTFLSGFVARANLSDNGFTLRWTGTNCATQLFTGTRPFKLKVTVDEDTKRHDGGSITEQGAWRCRDFGEAKVITITPDSGYLVKYLKIDGNEIPLDGFDENGYMEINTGYSVTDSNLNPGVINEGTETVKLYQRENGVIDVLLPAQYFLGLDSTFFSERTDHWIDTSFVPGDATETCTITNELSASDDPTTPDDSDKTDQTDKTDKTGKSGSNGAKTGDEINLILLIMLLITSMLIITGLYIDRKMKRA